MRSTDEALAIRHNEAAHRFEVLIEGELARADYRLDGGVMRMVHTEVPRALEGRGVAAQLVAAAFDHARAHGLRVLPQCSYVRSYMRRHAETQSLLPVGATLG